MTATRELSVTLSDALMDHLQDEALRLDVPLEWLVASLVVDTLDKPERDSYLLASA